jgi:hypothetical protein
MCRILSRKMQAHPSPTFHVISMFHVHVVSLSGELISQHDTQLLLGGIVISLW